MSDLPPIPEPLWDTVPPGARAAILALLTTLGRRIADLGERANKNSTDSSRPPSSDPPAVKRRPPATAPGKEPGGQPGRRHHPRALAPPEKLRRVIGREPRECRRCGHRLHGDDPGPIRHQVAEVPPARPVVDEYRPHRLGCPRCHRSTRAALPQGATEGATGHRLRAILGVLAGGYRPGERPIRQPAPDLPGLSISTGMTRRSERRGPIELTAPAERLREHVRRAGSPLIDETSWKRGRGKMRLRVAVTKLVTVFTIAPTRRADVAKGMPGCAAGEVVIGDRLESYARIERRQFRWAHLRRDLRAMIDRGGEAGGVGQRLLEHSDALLGWWHRVRDGTPARSGSRT